MNTLLFEPRSGKSVDYEIVVIGGGPAGSTVATLLSQWGRRVLLLEKDHFPREHIGESLLPGTVAVMKRMGVYEKVDDAGFVHKYGATYVWGKSRDPWTIHFSEVTEKPIHTFQVNRAKFDKILLDHSQESGVTVLQGCRATGVRRSDTDVMLVDYLDQNQSPQTAACRICVDASGQNSFLGRDLGLRKLNPSLRNIALFTYFEGGKSILDLVPDLSPEDRGNVYVATNEVGWFWYLPQGGDRYGVGLVTDAAHSSEINRVGRTRFYLDLIDATPEIKYLLKDARMESDSVDTQSDWSYVCSRVQGPGYLLVGDAAAFIDPILASGIDLAMEGALKAAFAINTLLSTRKWADQAMPWYEKEYQTDASDYLHMATHWYHGNRSQKEWFSAAKRLVPPERNLSLRQAFIYLSGGFTTGLAGRNPPNLLSVGGFPPHQLNTIYENLDASLPEKARKSVTKSLDHEPAEPVSKEVAGENIGETYPRFAPGVVYSRDMQTRDNELVPVIKIVQEVDGIPWKRHGLFPAYWPLLERIDGKRSVRDIVDELAYLPGYMQHGTLGERNKMMTELFQELYDQNITLPGQQRRATGRLQRRPQRAAATQPATIVEKPAATPNISRNDPCPCGSGRKYKRCHGRMATSR